MIPIAPSLAQMVRTATLATAALGRLGEQAYLYAAPFARHAYNTFTDSASRQANQYIVDLGRNTTSHITAGLPRIAAARNTRFAFVPYTSYRRSYYPRYRRYNRRNTYSRFGYNTRTRNYQRRSYRNSQLRKYKFRNRSTLHRRY